MFYRVFIKNSFFKNIIINMLKENCLSKYGYFFQTHKKITVYNIQKYNYNNCNSFGLYASLLCLKMGLSHKLR